MSGIQRLFEGMRISSTGLSSERARMDVISENIANARTTRTPEGGPYVRKLVEFETLVRREADGTMRTVGVRAARIVPDEATPVERLHQPGHPDADAQGWVEYPNVNTTMEIADLITAMRAYEANLNVQDSFVRMAERAIQLLR